MTRLSICLAALALSAAAPAVAGPLGPPLGGSGFVLPRPDVRGTLVLPRFERIAERLDAWADGIDRFATSLDDDLRVLRGDLAARQARVDVLTEGGLRVRVEIVDRPDGTAMVRMNLSDEVGAPVEGAKVATPDNLPVPITLAGPGEIVIDDLEVSQGSFVTVFTPDGDHVVIWLDEGE